MAKKKLLLDTSDELIVQPMHNGIKLIRPNQFKKSSNLTPTLRVLNLMQLPLNIGFLNTQSVVQNINDVTATSVGLCTKKDALGDTIYAVARKQSADYAMEHDKKVLKTRKLVILDENYTRLSDEINFQTKTIKTPWYNEKNELIGVFFCTITFGLPGAYSLNNSMALLFELGLFNGIQSHSIFKNVLPNTEIYIDNKCIPIMQTQCLYHLVRGKTNKMIAKALNLSPRTVEHYLDFVKNKLKVYSRPELIEKCRDYL